MWGVRSNQVQFIPFPCDPVWVNVIARGHFFGIWFICTSVLHIWISTKKTEEFRKFCWGQPSAHKANETRNVFTLATLHNWSVINNLLIISRHSLIVLICRQKWHTEKRHLCIHLVRDRLDTFCFQSDRKVTTNKVMLNGYGQRATRPKMCMESKTVVIVDDDVSLDTWTTHLDHIQRWSCDKCDGWLNEPNNAPELINKRLT